MKRGLIFTQKSCQTAYISLVKYLFRFISKAVTLLTVIDSFRIIEEKKKSNRKKYFYRKKKKYSSDAVTSFTLRNAITFETLLMTQFILCGNETNFLTQPHKTIRLSIKAANLLSFPLFLTLIYI